MKDLVDRVAVVTGAAQGIGRAAALAFARHGMHVVAANIDEDGAKRVDLEVSALGRRAWAVRTDVSEANDVRELLSRCLSLAGGVHVVMNNAGIARFGPALELTDDDWSQVIATNLWGVIHGCRTFGPHLLEQRAGHIINTASVAGLTGLPKAASYVTSKFGVVGLSEALRFELAPFNVGVTAVCPGFTKALITEGGGSTRMMEAVKKYASDPHDLADRIVEAVRRDEPMVKFGPEPHLMWGLRRFSSRLYDRAGRALGTAMLRP